MIILGGRSYRCWRSIVYSAAVAIAFVARWLGANPSIRYRKLPFERGLSYFLCSVSENCILLSACSVPWVQK